MTREEGSWAIFLNGSYGVGKSATLDHLGDALADAGQPFSLMDVDWYHRSWPTADFDPGNTVLEAKNMAAVWSNYRTAGPRQLVISGVIAGQEDLDRYTAALQLRIRPIRLVATPRTTEARLRAGTALPRTTSWTGTSEGTKTSATASQPQP